MMKPIIRIIEQIKLLITVIVILVVWLVIGTIDIIKEKTNNVTRNF